MIAVGAVPNAPSPSAKVGGALNVRDGIWPLSALRHPPDAGASGWFIWAGEELSGDPAFDASALISLGVLEGSEQTFAVPAGVDLHDFVLVDVSQEPLDGGANHSGDSIVRGELEFS